MSKEDRKNRSLIFRKTMVIGVTPIILSAALIIALLSVVECYDAFQTGQNSIEYDEAGSVIIPTEEDFSEFVFRGRMSIVGRALAWIGFFVFGLCRTGWQVKPAYDLTISVVWLLLSVIMLVVWLQKWWSAHKVIETGRTRYGLKRWEYGETRRLCQITVQDAVFVGLAVLLSVFQIVLIPARFMMTPILILALIFLVIEIIRQTMHYISNNRESALSKLGRKIRCSQPYRRFLAWKAQL